MKKQLLILTLLLHAAAVSFSQVVKEPAHGDSTWSKNYPPFRIAGNLYYVGTNGLASYLITTNKGNILINTGLASSEEQIKQNITSLGFKFSDTKILLTTQAHYDHMGAMAAIKAQTGAKFFVNKPDAATAASGGKEDYELGKYGITFKPIKADKLLKDGEIISLGEMKLQMLSHPGHTKGSSSFLVTVKDSSRSYRVLIANMPTIISDRRFEEITDYPSISKDFASTLKKMKLINFDLWVASHSGQFDLHDKRKPDDVYNPNIFADKQVYLQYLNELQKAYDDKIKKDVAEADKTMR